MIALDAQDRGLWDREKIDSGDRLLRAALARRNAGPYQVQAAISAVHANSPSHDETDWREITLLYRKLHEMQPSWVVKLNEVVALSYAEGAEVGLAALDELDLERLERYQPFWAARADLLRRTGRTDQARTAYRRALELTRNAAERRFLEDRLAALISK
jgi:RNA polymerase sigma-70 factor (ECF subfamily)